MVDNICMYKSLNISIEAVVKNPEMIKFVPDHLKTKKMYAVKKLSYLLRYVLDQYKIQQMCDKAILENAGTLKYFPDCYKNHEMCNKAVENYPHVLESVPECYKTQEMCHRAVHRCFFVFDYIPDQYKTQEICNFPVSLYPSFIVY